MSVIKEHDRVVLTTDLAGEKPAAGDVDCAIAGGAVSLAIFDDRSCGPVHGL